MQFTRLRLLGFKSFVDPTELVIAPGLTGVVGPNGCGKSNLLEALRWVMGESRASVMRGEGMEDVIFAGSAGRPARNRAEVTLTLDNADRRAPSGFNEADELEILRRITRDAGSAYRANGREARARDIAILFADASSGAQSPSLVRQGQISELVEARPKARRRILEDAAGIAGLTQRRHEAELKLRATEANLERVADLLEAQAAQIAALSRQARQAARYREIAASLRRAEALLVWRMWRDAQDARESAAAALAQAMTAAASARRASEGAGEARDAAEARVAPCREERAVAVTILQRLDAERDRIHAEAQAAARRIADLEAARDQLVADRGREAALDRDAVEMSERLRAARTAIEAEEADCPAARALAARAAASASETLAAAEAACDALAQASARLGAEFQAAVRALSEAGSRAQAAVRAQAADDAASATALRDCAAAEDAAKAARATAETKAQAARNAETELAGLEVALQAARTIEAATRMALAGAEGEAKALGSEAAALDRLLARPAGAPAQVLDDLTVTAGYEPALGAALADDLALPILANGAEGAGWRDLPGEAAAPALPEGVQPLSDHVAGVPALARRLSAVGVVARGDGARLQATLGPGVRIVSREGDLWRWDGLTIAAGGADAAARRLQQRNRLTEVRATLAAAQQVLAEAREAQGRAATDLAAFVAEEAAARGARRAAEQAATEAARAAGRADAALEALRARVAALQEACARRAEEAEAAHAALAAAEAARAALADPSAARAALDTERLRVEAARLAMLTRRAEADEIERAGAARQKRLAEIERELPRWSDRRATADSRLADLAQRAERVTVELEAAHERPRALAAERAAQDTAREAAQSRDRKATEVLAGAEAAFRTCEGSARDAERAAGEAREARARAEALAEAAEAHALTLAERVRSELEAEPDAILAEHDVGAEAVPDTATLERQVAVLRTSRDSLGAVNLRAEEDAREIEAERETLARDRADLEEAIRTLRHGIGTLNREGRTRLLTAFDAVNRNFSALFRHLFGGGEASLVLVESDDPLEAGLEIMCQPPGKKLSTLSLLSGGEQTLTALSLIFAVFLANPSPICVLDEVDAPLDDANVTRFCDLLDEMTARTATRFLIITHHAVTMARMDRLFGVTMAEPGVSQLVSVDLAEAERLVEVEA